MTSSETWCGMFLSGGGLGIAGAVALAVGCCKAAAVETAAACVGRVCAALA